MSNKHGDFIWYELMTDDADAAQEFYGKVLGWKFNSAGEGDIDYRQFSMNGVHVGGVLPLTPGEGKGKMHPCWMGYIGVDDVDRLVGAITSANGSVHMPPQDIPGVGRFAFVSDPQGALFYVMTPIPQPGGGGSQSFAATEPMIGHCAWNELSTTNAAGAFNFYHDLFGWTKDGEMDMGEMGKYEFLRHDFMLGAMMPKMPELPMSVWTYYFRVADIDAAVEIIKANGGQILHGPDEIPGGEFSLNAMDPQHAAFALVGPRKKK
jgi:predicted enzyme related to lactoylglutathione lyase